MNVQLEMLGDDRIECFIDEVTRCFGAPPASIILRQGDIEMPYDNTNRGALFRNDEKDGENDRDYSGTLDVDGTEYWISGWVKTSKAGKRYLSLAVTPKNADTARPKKSTCDDLDDKIPF
jgi:hypothetical protein